MTCHFSMFFVVTLMQNVFTETERKMNVPYLIGGG